MSYAQRLEALTASGPALCVGIDPHPALLESWGFGDTTEGLNGWSQLVGAVVKSSGIRVAKPQVALFERVGVAGMSTLSALIGSLRQAGVLVIGDAKRGDIGSTMEGYADAWLRPGSDFEVDALTVVPYQGLGALEPALERARTHDKGLFVLAATSNPEARVTQSALRHDGHTVAGGVVHDLHRWVATNGAKPESYGLVVGATIDLGALGVDLRPYPPMPILAPGYGAQGATLSSARGDFPGSLHVLPVVARSVLQAGADGFEQAIEGALAEVASA